MCRREITKKVWFAFSQATSNPKFTLSNPNPVWWVSRGGETIKRIRADLVLYCWSSKPTLEWGERERSKKEEISGRCYY